MRYLSKASSKAISGTALLRLDFNTEDEWRMEASLSTIRFLLKRANKIVIMSHRGRPEGQDPRFSLENDAKKLSALLHSSVWFIPALNFSEAKELIQNAPKKSIFVLENLRFDSREDKNDPGFAKQLAELADFYVNDAFAVSHRDDASVVAVTKFLPSFAGLEFEKELKALGGVMKKPKKPLVLVLGGAKAHDKLGLLRKFQNKADYFLIGGAAANTFLFLKGIDVQKSLKDESVKDYAELEKILQMKKVFIPVDWRMSGEKILDIGPKTEKLFAEKIRSARTIIWNGPMGYMEDARFRKGSLAVARAIAANRRAFSLTGGGESVTFLKKNKLDKKFSFISTGGGAMLEFLAGKSLPGIEALNGKRHV